MIRIFAHKIGLSAIALTLYLSAAPLVLASNGLKMPSKYEAAKHFSFSVSKELESIPRPSASFLLLLRAPNGGFPTINVLILPGELGKSSSLASNTLDEYRLAGLGDAKLLESNTISSGVLRGHELFLSFSDSGEKRHASSLQIEGKGVSYVITVVSNEIEDVQLLSKEILGSMEFGEGFSPIIKHAESSNIAPTNMILILVITLAGYWIIRRFRARS